MCLNDKYLIHQYTSIIRNRCYVCDFHGRMKGKSTTPTELPTDYHHNSIKRSMVCVEGLGRISRSGLTQDIKMGSCVFQCDVPHQLIKQRQVGPVYCDGVERHVLCLRHGIAVWQHIGQSTTATSRHRCNMISDVSKRR